MKNYQSLVETLISENAVKATYYISPKEIIRAVRTRYGGKNKKIDKKSNIEISLTIGKPNYLEREFIEKCKEAKEPFPIKKIQIKY